MEHSSIVNAKVYSHRNSNTLGISRHNRFQCILAQKLALSIYSPHSWAHWCWTLFLCLPQYSHNLPVSNMAILSHRGICVQKYIKFWKKRMTSTLIMLFILFNILRVCVEKTQLSLWYWLTIHHQNIYNGIEPDSYHSIYWKDQN